jgi:squalene-associated FAD-dependent desaturase
VARPLTQAAPLRVAVIGAGWGGLAAAVQATTLGHSVTLHEMAAIAGGRARCAGTDQCGLAFDNGQHILIGAYLQTLRIMRHVGVDTDSVLLRRPLDLRDAQGRGLVLLPGPPLLALARALLAARHWRVRERTSLLAAMLGWFAHRFNCPAEWTVERLTQGIAPRVVEQLISPLCIAALNTPPSQASATVFLRVLKDALFSSAGASDLLLPRVDLSRVWPQAACHWLGRRGVELRFRTRVQGLSRNVGGWILHHEGEERAFDRVILATSAREAARLAEKHAPNWSALARNIGFEPIITVLLRAPQSRLDSPMLALACDASRPAQFVFDIGQLRQGEPGADGVLAFVISSASAWVQAGGVATRAAVIDQARSQLGSRLGPEILSVRQISEQRATFACTPLLTRPGAHIDAGLIAAGDYVAGPYPSTLEGAVRSGIAAACAIAGTPHARTIGSAPPPAAARFAPDSAEHKSGFRHTE